LGWATLAGSLKLAHGPAEGFDLPLVGILLALGQLESFEHLFHILKRLAEHVDDAIDLLDGLLDGRRRGGLKIMSGGRSGCWPVNGSGRGPLHWSGGGFLGGRHRFGTFFYRAHVFLGFPFRLSRGLGAAGQWWPTTTATATATASVTAAGGRCWPLGSWRSTFRLRLFSFRSGSEFFFGSHLPPQIALNRPECKGNLA
jgi:hypothetical protein